MPHKETKPEIEKARDLRRRMPDPERYLWSLLRNRKCANLKFRRQAPIGPFVVDFYCEAAKLAVELDGMSHDGRGRYDKSRQRYLEASGLTVFRVHNEDLLKDAEAILLGIAKAARIDLRTYFASQFGEAQATNETARHPLTPNPSPQGEGDRPAAGGRRGRATSQPPNRREQQHPPNAP